MRRHSHITVPKKKSPTCNGPEMSTFLAKHVPISPWIFPNQPLRINGTSAGSSESFTMLLQRSDPATFSQLPLFPPFFRASSRNAKKSLLAIDFCLENCFCGPKKSQKSEIMIYFTYIGPKTWLKRITSTKSCSNSTRLPIFGGQRKIHLRRLPPAPIEHVSGNSSHPHPSPSLLETPGLPAVISSAHARSKANGAVSSKGSTARALKMWVVILEEKNAPNKNEP